MKLTNLIIGSLISVAAATERTLDIYYRSITSNSKVNLGEIRYDPQTNTSSFTEKSALPKHESLCLGTDKLPNNECFIYLETKEQPPTGNFVVLVDDSGLPSDVSLELHKGEIWGAQTKPIAKGPVPNFEPANREVSQEPVKKKTVKKITTTKVENGEEIQIEEEIIEEEEEDNRSWVQKNWLYIVIPLVILMFLSPEDEKK